MLGLDQPSEISAPPRASCIPQQAVSSKGCLVVTIARPLASWWSGKGPLHPEVCRCFSPVIFHSAPTSVESTPTYATPTRTKVTCTDGTTTYLATQAGSKSCVVMVKPADGYAMIIAIYGYLRVHTHISTDVNVLSCCWRGPDSSGPVPSALIIPRRTESSSHPNHHQAPGDTAARFQRPSRLHRCRTFDALF